MQEFDLFVIGAGSGGVRCARIAAQNGARVAIAERRHWTVFGGEYRHDIEQYALLDNDFLPDNNLFTAASRWGRFREGLPIMRDLSLVSVQRDLFHGFTQTAILRYQNSVPQFQVMAQPRPGAHRQHRAARRSTREAITA